VYQWYVEMLAPLLVFVVYILYDIELDKVEATIITIQK